MRTLPFLRDGHMIIFHVDVFPFRWVFLVEIIYCPLPPLSALQTPPSLDFSEYFLLMHAFICIYIFICIFINIYIQPTRVVRLLTSYLWGDAFPSLYTTDRIPPVVLAATVPGAVAVDCRSRSFSQLSPPVSDKMAACCFYSSDTGGGEGGGGVQQH